MGYLINPIGFRVGHTRDWVDVWFCYKDMYPEFLHFVLKIRVFLNYHLCSEPSFKDYEYEDNRLFFKKIGTIINTLKDYFDFLGTLSLFVIRNNFRLKWKEIFNSFFFVSKIKRNRNRVLQNINNLVFSDKDNTIVDLEKKNEYMFSLVKQNVFSFEDSLKDFIKDGSFNYDEISDIFNEAILENNIVKGDKEGIFFKSKDNNFKKDKLKDDQDFVDDKEDKKYKLKILDPSFFEEEDLDFNSDFFLRKMDYIKQMFEEKIEQKVSNSFLKKLTMNDVHQILDSILNEILGMENPNTFYFDGILFSHFKIVLNLFNVYISVFLYPGKYWDFIYDNLLKVRYYYKRKRWFSYRNNVDNSFLGLKHNLSFSKNWIKYGYLNSLYGAKDFPFFYDRIFSKLKFSNSRFLDNENFPKMYVLRNLKKKNKRMLQFYNRRFFFKSKKLKSKNKKKFFISSVGRFFSQSLIDFNSSHNNFSKKSLYLDSLKLQFKPWSFKKRFFLNKNIKFSSKKRSRLNFRRRFNRISESVFLKKKYFNLYEKLKYKKPFWKKKNFSLRFFYKKRNVERWLKKLNLLRFFLNRKLRIKFNNDFLLFLGKHKFNRIFSVLKKRGKFRNMFFRRKLLYKYKRFSSFFKYWWKYRYLLKHKIWIKKEMYYSKKKEIRKSFVFKKSSFFNLNSSYLRFLRKHKTGFHFLLLFFLFFKPFSVIDNFRVLFNKFLNVDNTSKNGFFKTDSISYLFYNNNLKNFLVNIFLYNIYFSLGYGTFFFRIVQNLSNKNFSIFFFKRYNPRFFFFGKKLFNFYYNKFIFFYSNFFFRKSFFFYNFFLRKTFFFYNFFKNKTFSCIFCSSFFSIKKKFFFFFKTNFIKKSRLFFFFSYFLKNKLKNFFFKRDNSKNFSNNFQKHKSFLIDNFFISSFYFFIVWIFNTESKFRLKKKSQIGNYMLQFLETSDWEKENIRRFQLRRFFKNKKFYKKGSKLLGKFFFLNWDFLISFLIDKFFFKYNVDIKYFLIFILFFKDVRNFSQKSSYLKLSSSLKSRLAVSFLNIHYENNPLLNFDYSLEPILHRLVPFENIFINTFLIHNKHITALFLARYFSIKFANGHYFRSAVNPVVKDLKSVVNKNLSLLNKSNYIDKDKMFSFLKFRSFIFKNLLLKNFFLYKFLFLKFFFFFKTFFNFYLLFFFCYFYTYLNQSFYLILGISKNFFFKKHAYNFFFNYDFNTFLEKVFNFFSLILLNFFSNVKNYFNVVIDEIFSSLNIVLLSIDYFNIDLSSIKTASFFFNKVIVYNYWFYNMTWLHNANYLNKMRARIFPKEPLSGLIYGFKFHFRGRFSRKQRAASIIFQKGSMPLTTMSSNIDYGFVTMPLLNSLVSIKVWLFKNKSVDSFYFGKVSNRKLLRLDSVFYRNKRLLFYKHFLKNIRFNFLGKKHRDKYRLKAQLNDPTIENTFFKNKKKFLKYKSFVNLKKKRVWFLKYKKLKRVLLNNNNNSFLINRNIKYNSDYSNVLFVRRKYNPLVSFLSLNKVLLNRSGQFKLYKEVFFNNMRLVIDNHFYFLNFDKYKINNLNKNELEHGFLLNKQESVDLFTIFFNYRFNLKIELKKLKNKLQSKGFLLKYLNMQIIKRFFRYKFFAKKQMLIKKFSFFYKLLPSFFFFVKPFFFFSLFSYSNDDSIFFFFFNKFFNLFYYFFNFKKFLILKNTFKFYFILKKLRLNLRCFLNIRYKGLDYIYYSSYYDRFRRSLFLQSNFFFFKLRFSFLEKKKNKFFFPFFFKPRNFFFISKLPFDLNLINKFNLGFFLYNKHNFILNSFFFKKKLINYFVGFRKKSFKKFSFFFYNKIGSHFFFHLSFKVFHIFTCINKTRKFYGISKKTFKRLPLKTFFFYKSGIFLQNGKKFNISFFFSFRYINFYLKF